jgi:hypothetical protein
MFRQACRIMTISVIVSISVSCGNYERATAHYSIWQEAVKDGATTRGWIPSFLPNSSTNISEIHDLDTNAGAFCFFAPASDLKLLASQLERVPALHFSTIGPWIDGPPTCWPRSLAKRRLSVLVENDDFEIYQKVESIDKPGTNRVWYFAINALKGTGYGWHKGD